MKLNCIREFARTVFKRSHPKFHEECTTIIKQTLEINNYPHQTIARILAQARRTYNITPTTPTIPDPRTYTCISYCPPVSTQIKTHIEKVLPNIKIIEKPILKLNRKVFTKIHSNIPAMRTKNTVYKINCQNCDKFYIGHTGKRLECRIQQHKNDCRLRRCNGNGTALSTHSLEMQHQFDFENPEILEIEPNKTKRETKESYHIKNKQTHTVNFKVDNGRLHPSYK